MLPLPSEVISLPSKAAPLRHVAVEESFSDVLDSLHLDSLEEELLSPSCEVSPSLSICANIHQSQFFSILGRCAQMQLHKKILKEGYRLDFVNGVLPGNYDERNNQSARLEPTFVRDNLDSMSSSSILDLVLEKPT